MQAPPPTTTHLPGIATPRRGVQASAPRAGRVPPVPQWKSPVVLGEKLMQVLPDPVVAVANRHLEIVSR